MPVMAKPKPSADNVGCEFVRQYYTMLNKDPRQVHRFYSKDSVFFHGGPGNSRGKEHVVGQEEIYEAIELLKFKDCHAKILQVDSQFTVGDSVVVQVCGEFSNNGEPTKKFVQTFVLVPEGLKKYHVRNDIFRYQEERFPDEVSDETGEVTNESEVDDEVIDERPLESKSDNFNNLINHVPEQTAGVSFSDEEEQKVSPMTNGSSDTDNEIESEEKVEPVEAELEEIVVEKLAPHEPVTTINPEQTDSTVFENIESPDDEIAPPADENNHEHKPEPEPEPSGPMSWAAMASKTPKPNPQVSRQYEQKKQFVASSPQLNTEPVMKTQPQHVGAGGRGNIGGNNAGSKDRFSGRNAPDNCQVFIGNLPANLDEKQVQDVFSKFGKIIEVRLNPKNFGFVIFDSPEPAEQVLKNLPITINGQEINIEEKKPSGSLGRGGRGGPSGNRGKPGGSGRGMNTRGGPVGKGSGGNTPSGGRGGTGGNQRGGGQNNSPGSRGRRDRR
ncbi:ras GTPase-activating protein-binding protein 2-like [Dendronephthya gigantea]|uniref:ras GTPase-activating protein-binding protein 2-like n=1 Tax=Dendronephthya gigantea TaxID=151771 RepID=UPI00106982F5|nr:ras GTPase-activating protein-binding protein 2-like [Dendronephthya gigantea]